MPKILSDDVPMRTPVRETQLAEQLVEVPTIVSWSLLQLIMKQNVDIPVPGRGGRISCLQGFPPGQSSTTTFFSAERISERIVEQIVDIPVSCGDFRPGQSSSSVVHTLQLLGSTLRMSRFKGFFELISPGEKSASVTRHMGARVPRHVSSSTSFA